MSVHYNTTITYYPDTIQVKYYPEFSPSGGGSSNDKESPESVSFRSLTRTRKMVFDYARCNSFDYFVTLTFNPKLIDSFDYSESQKAMSSWLDSLRRRFPFMKYLGVPELHKSGRYHFHFLMSGIDGITMVDSGHRTPKGQIIYNLPDYRYGFSTAIKVYESGAKLAGYLSKYISKDLAQHSKNRKRYWCSRNLALPEIDTCFMSLQELSFKFSGLEVLYNKTIEDGKGCGIIEYSLNTPI